MKKLLTLSALMAFILTLSACSRPAAPADEAQSTATVTIAEKRQDSSTATITIAEAPTEDTSSTETTTP